MLQHVDSKGADTEYQKGVVGMEVGLTIVTDNTWSALLHAVAQGFVPLYEVKGDPNP